MVGGIWNVEQPTAAGVLWGLFALGWLILVLSSFMINHFDLFGTRQVYLHLRKKEYVPLEFEKRGFYKYIRHPLMLGWIVAFWSTPHMTVGHLVFSVGTTLYILIGIQFEERDLVKFIGEEYRDYRRRVGMLIPWLGKRKPPADKE